MSKCSTVEPPAAIVVVVDGVDVIIFNMGYPPNRGGGHDVRVDQDQWNAARLQKIGIAIAHAARRDDDPINLATLEAAHHFDLALRVNIGAGEKEAKVVPACLFFNPLRHFAVEGIGKSRDHQPDTMTALGDEATRH